MSAVFNRYPVGGGEMLLALALADVSRDDGKLMVTDSVVDLARKTRQTRKGVQRQLQRMVGSGWLRVVKKSDGGRSRASIYEINADWINGGVLQDHPAAPDQELDHHENCDPGSLFPLRNQEARSGFQGALTATLEAGNRDPGSHAYRPTKPNTEIPPNPPRGAAAGSTCRETSALPALMTLRAWLADCKAKGENAIPADDPVYDYAERVGIRIELLHLHWAEFKRHWIDRTKRRRDWREEFRQSVRGNRFRLWWMPPGGSAELTTAGRQALAFHGGEIA